MVSVPRIGQGDSLASTNRMLSILGRVHGVIMKRTMARLVLEKAADNLFILQDFIL